MYRRDVVEFRTGCGRDGRRPSARRTIAPRHAQGLIAGWVRHRGREPVHGGWQHRRVGWHAGLDQSMGYAVEPPTGACRIDGPDERLFAMRREVFERLVRRTSGMGFKLLLDVLASSPHPLRFIELPYEFRSRQVGESKLDSQVAWDYVMLLLDKSIGRFVPVRLVTFCLVGAPAS